MRLNVKQKAMRLIVRSAENYMAAEAASHSLGSSSLPLKDATRNLRYVAEQEYQLMQKYVHDIKEIKGLPYYQKLINHLIEEEGGKFSCYMDGDIYSAAVVAIIKSVVSVIEGLPPIEEEESQSTN